MFKFLLLISLSIFAYAETMCNVKVCNKIERISLDPFAHIKDKFGETCFDIGLPKSEAYVGNILSEESKWYQGGFNPTKKSITKVKQVNYCE